MDLDLNENLEERLVRIQNGLDSLNSLFQRRLLNDKAKNKMIMDIENYLDKREKIDSGIAFTQLFKELLLALDSIMILDISKSEKEALVGPILEVMYRRGLKECPNNEKFNPTFDEITGVVPISKTDNVENVVYEIVQKGYVLGDTVLRTRRVIVSKDNGE
ncbi:nucleotide exchange factor GrpE [Anaerococcus vaginalis]|uniref:nucleotide exchange factor GrpE n=1 Tax=Anaerococcus vaginalis TaxID=33037 RepID=UPI0029103C18|nr:nucleotide exchange factor GrpE [Anaerococcus vaginalis]MDU5560170.1 nucleotide exchange factor GrpE [Anaerococcus vaginalis]